MVKFNYYGGCFYGKEKEVYKVKLLTEGKKNVIAALINEYGIKAAYDIKKRLLSLIFCNA